MNLKDVKQAVDSLIAECGLVKIISAFGGGASCGIATTILLLNIIPDKPAIVKEVTNAIENTITKENKINEN